MGAHSLMFLVYCMEEGYKWLPQFPSWAQCENKNRLVRHRSRALFFLLCSEECVIYWDAIWIFLYRMRGGVGVWWCIKKSFRFWLRFQFEFYRNLNRAIRSRYFTNFSHNSILKSINVSISILKNKSAQRVFYNDFFFYVV